MRTSIFDLRYRTKDVLKAVERGETVAVLYRGKERARIVPSALAHAKDDASGSQSLRNLEEPERSSERSALCV